LCEFQFTPTESWDWTVPGLIYNRIHEEFPTKREQPILEMKVRAAGTDAAQEIRQGVARMRFLTPDETGIVQVGPNLLAVNRLPPYPGWAGFRASVLTQLGNYIEVAQPLAIERVSVRYINRVALKTTHLELADYFRALPGLPANMTGNITAFFTSADIAHDAPSTRLKLTFGSAVSGNERESHFIMDLEMTSLEPVEMDAQPVGAWLDVAHERLEQAFDASFTDRTHAEVFGEVAG